MPNLKDRLVELKNQNNLLQKTIAQDLNISLRSYQYYQKREREPSSSVLIKLANYFDVSIDYLVGRTDKKEINK